MSWFSRKEAAYNDGYAHGHLSDEDLKDVGHTRESYAKRIEEIHELDPYDPRLTADEREAFWGLLDGARDLRKK